MPFFSLIIINYNNANRLNRCLSSILNQSFHDFEIIFVDDGSTDNSVNICNRWNKRFPLFKVITKNNEGPSSARFEGLRYVQGEYVIFVDSDDWLNINSLQCYRNAISAQSPDLVIAPHYRVFDRFGLIKELVDLPYYGYIDGAAFVDKYLVSILYSSDNSIPVYLWGKCYRRDLLLKAEIKKTDVVLGEDRIWMLDILPIVNKVCFSDYPSVFYRWGGLTSKFYIPELNDRVKFYQKAKQVALDNNLVDWYAPLLHLMSVFLQRYISVGINAGVPKEKLIQLLKKEIDNSAWREIGTQLKDYYDGFPFSDAFINEDIYRMYDIIYSEWSQQRITLTIKKVLSSIF